MATLTPERKETSLWQAWKIQRAVLGALILRELQTRHGRHNIGYLWMVVEPMLLATVVTLMHVGEGGGEATWQSMPVFPFTVLGYCNFIIFRNNFTRAEGVLDWSANMMYHSRITIFDILFARMICETAGAIVSAIMLMTIGIALGLAEFPIRPLYVFLGTSELFVWSFGLSLMVSAYTYGTHFVGRLVHPIGYFMFPLSGAFITMSLLPEWAREYMAWNPMMAMFETIRYGEFAGADDRYMYQSYVIVHCVVSLFWGLVALRHVRKYIHAG